LLPVVSHQPGIEVRARLTLDIPVTDIPVTDIPVTTFR
jgi:hypothetical protein